MTELMERWHRLRQADTWTFATMLFSAALSLTASFVLSVDAVALAANPDVNLSCNINATISCGTVGQSWQASVFGFPNAFLGLIAEPVVITIALASLASVRFPRWFMFAAQVVYTLGFLFAYWLFYEAMFNIGALCPWCLLVTVSTTFVFTSMTQWNIRENNLFLPEGLQAKAFAFVDKGWFTVSVIAWFALIIVLELLKWGHRFL